MNKEKVHAETFWIKVGDALVQERTVFFYTDGTVLEYEYQTDTWKQLTSARWVR